MCFIFWWVFCMCRMTVIEEPIKWWLFTCNVIELFTWWCHINDCDGFVKIILPVGITLYSLHKVTGEINTFTIRTLSAINTFLSLHYVCYDISIFSVIKPFIFSTPSHCNSSWFLLHKSLFSWLSSFYT